jgi:hypothetical protein
MGALIIASKEAFELATQGQHDNALTVINDYQTTSDVERRIVGHTIAQIYMIKGDFNEAVRILIATRRAFGDNLCLLADIVYCYYGLSDFKRWTDSFNELKSEFSLHGDFLIPDHKASLQLTIAKFLEEEGRIKESMDAYAFILETVDEQTNSTRFYRVLCQSFRALATFGGKSSLAQSYAILEMINANNVDRHGDIDVQQCLLLGEIGLLGVEVAYKRLDEILRSKTISKADKQLLFYDFVEECLARNLQLPAQLNEYLGELRDLNAYEQCLHEIAFLNSDSYLTNRLHRLAGQMSFSCYLRLLGVSLARKTRTEAGPEIKRKFKLAIDTLDIPSRNLWIQRYMQFLAPSNNEIHFDQETGELTFENRKINITKKEQVMKLLPLCKSETITMADLFTQLGKDNYEDNDYRSLRMVIHRLNKVLFELTGTPKLIEIGKQEVRIKFRLVIK